MAEQDATPAQGTPTAGGEQQPTQDAGQQPSEQPAGNTNPAPAAPTQQAAEQKPTQEQQPTQEAKQAPEAYDLKLPENSILDKSHVDTVAALAKERGLSNEEAQAMLDRDSKLLADRAEREGKELNEQTAAWKTECMNDKEIGGDNYTKNVEMAHRVLEKYADKEFITELEKTGLGNHPMLNRMLVRMGKEMSEDTLKGGGNTVVTKKSAEEIFYPELNNQQ